MGTKEEGHWNHNRNNRSNCSVRKVARQRGRCLSGPGLPRWAARPLRPLTSIRCRIHGATSRRRFTSSRSTGAPLGVQVSRGRPLRSSGRLPGLFSRRGEHVIVELERGAHRMAPHQCKLKCWSTNLPILTQRFPGTSARMGLLEGESAGATGQELLAGASWRRSSSMSVPSGSPADHSEGRGISRNQPIGEQENASVLRGARTVSRPGGWCSAAGRLP